MLFFAYFLIPIFPDANNAQPSPSLTASQVCNGSWGSCLNSRSASVSSFKTNSDNEQRHRDEINLRTIHLFIRSRLLFNFYVAPAAQPDAASDHFALVLEKLGDAKRDLMPCVHTCTTVRKD